MCVFVFLIVQCRVPGLKVSGARLQGLGLCDLGFRDCLGLRVECYFRVAGQ